MTRVAVSAALTLLVIGCRQAAPRTGGAAAEGSPAQHRAAELPVEIGPAGDRIRGTMYVAAGRGPHPTVLFLHGFPGRQEWPDFVKPLRSSGRNVLAIHYRGTWNSDGRYSPNSVLEDVERARAFLRTPGARARYRSSDAPVALVGHSFGAWVALTAARRSPERECVAALALSNLGRLGRDWSADRGRRRAMVDGFRRLERSGRLRTSGPEELVQAVIDRAAEFDAATYGPGLRDHPVLLLGAQKEVVAPLDEHHRLVADSLRKAGGVRLTAVEMFTSHNFNEGEAQVAAAVAEWLTKECR